MEQRKFLFRIGLSVFFVFGIFCSSLFAQTLQVLDLSSPKTRNHIQASGFIAAQPVPSWGKIVGTLNQVENLTSGEVVFIKLESGKNVKPGDRFAIGQIRPEVIHPVSQKRLGHLVMVPGELAIVEAHGNIVTAKIEKSYFPILVGDLLLSPLPAPPSEMPIRSLKNVEGIILLSPEDARDLTEKEIVFIDRGRKDAVIVGDLFSVYKTGIFTKEILKANEKVPLVKIGELVVVSVQEETSTALITHSSDTFKVGDRVASGRE